MYRELLEKGSLSNEDLYLLDDSTCMYSFSLMRRTEDPVLSDLARRILDRDLFEFMNADKEEYLKQKCACLFVDGEAVCAPFGSAKFFNIILLGIAAGSGRLGLKRESVLHQMSLNLPERFLEINRQAFEAGFALGEKESL